MSDLYTAKLNKAIEYIRNNLDSRLSLEELSSEAGFSRFHFHQVFSAFTGETIYGAAARLRLERAAKALAETPSLTVKKAAAQNGYADTAGFSRAFKKLYGVSPSAWKNSVRITKPSSVAVVPYDENPESEPVDAEVRELEAFSVAYIKYAGAYAGDTALFIYLYNKLTTWAASMQLLTPECENLVVYHHPADISEDTRSKISLGVSVPNETETGGDFGKLRLGGGKYLVCRYTLGDDEYSSAWKQVYRQLIPERGLLPADGWCFERYPNTNDRTERYKSIVDLCVPVVRA